MATSKIFSNKSPLKKSIRSKQTQINSYNSRNLYFNCGRFRTSINKQNLTGKTTLKWSVNNISVEKNVEEN